MREGFFQSKLNAHRRHGRRGKKKQQARREYYKKELSEHPSTARCQQPNKINALAPHTSLLTIAEPDDKTIAAGRRRLRDDAERARTLESRLVCVKAAAWLTSTPVSMRKVVIGQSRNFVQVVVFFFFFLPEEICPGRISSVCPLFFNR